MPNGGPGVALDDGASNNHVGGADRPLVAYLPGNVISGNHRSGLVLRGWVSTQNTVAGNLIGTTRGGNAPVPNEQDGVDLLAGASANMVGGNGVFFTSHPGITIACNTGGGVQIDGTGTNGNTIAGNAIGTYAPGVVGKGNSDNGGNGVSVYDGAQQDLIGGSLATSGNIIADNVGIGVAIGRNLQDTTTVSDAVLSNSIFDNAGLGIDLASDGVTPNTLGSPHAGPKNLLSTPIIDSATYASVGQLTVVQMSLNASKQAPFTIQRFGSPSPGPSFHGGGKVLLMQIPAMTDSNGNWSGVVNLPFNLKDQYLSATTTDAMNDTSEFCKAYQVVSASGMALGGSLAETAPVFGAVLDAARMTGVQPGRW
jgi:hypothetical protein